VQRSPLMQLRAWRSLSKVPGVVHQRVL